MFKGLSLIITLISILSGFADVANAQLKEIILYQGVVEFHQKATIYVSEGRNVITINELPESIISNTLNISSTSSVFISSYEHQSLTASSSKWKFTIKSLEDSLADVLLNLKQLSADKDVYLEEWNLITKNNTRIGADGGLDGVDLEEAADFYRRRLGEIKDQMLQIERGLALRNKLKNRLKKKITKLNNDQKRIGLLEVVINSAKNQEIDLNIQFLTKKAGWAPSYKIDYSSANESLSMEYNGLVTNNTGIDWEGVKLTLVTGLPKADLEEPALFPYKLHTLKVNNYKQQSQKMDENNEIQSVAYKKTLVTSNSARYDNVIPDVKYEESGAWVAFNLENPQFIPSDQKEYIIPINEVALNAEYHYLCIPKLETEAYHMAKVTDWEELRLLNGRANVYNDNKYVGNIIIDPYTVEDYIQIPLGTDGRIMVSREVNKAYTSTKSMGANVKKSFAYNIKVQNNRLDAINVVIHDQIPVSTNNQIHVELDEKTDGIHQLDEGLIIWNKIIETSKNAVVNIQYSVKYPKDLRINL